MRASLPLLIGLLLLQGCASAPPATSVFDRPRNSREVAIVPLYEPGAPGGVALANLQEPVARKLPPDRLPKPSPAAAKPGSKPRTAAAAPPVPARAETTTDAQRTQQAATLLKALYDTTGLSDAQFERLRTAEAALVRGENAAALRELQALKASTQKTRGYTVQRGDNLSTIAARESVYGNSLLWPLLWAANREAIPDPHRLRAGMTLQVRPSPTVDEVVQAIKEARQYPSRVRIGTVKTVKR